MRPDEIVQLADYRQRVAEIYARARQPGLPPQERWQRFRSDQDHIFKTHPQTALTPRQAADFITLRYYAYDPAYRFVLPVEFQEDREMITVILQDDGPTHLFPFGRVSFEIENTPVTLTIYWISGYGGGIFLPFKDGTNGQETYAGGRYLLDTIKGADLGWEGNQLVVDFNFAYNPSCAYNSRWHCPLPPPENHLAVSIRAGEQRFE